MRQKWKPVSRLSAGRRRVDESGSIGYELVLLVPVLVLLTLFVLWAGRGGRAELSADLAAEEAATAASLCCEEGDVGEPGRDLLVEGILATRPGLEFMCVGGLRPHATPDRGPDPEFVTEHWLEFEPAAGVRTGGVGILGVQFECETDGAVAPLRGLFPTITFRGQASEVVHRRTPPPNIGFSQSVFQAEETDDELVFVVNSPIPVPTDIQVDYEVTTVDEGFTPRPRATGSVTMTEGSYSVDVIVPLEEDDMLYEGPETLTLDLTRLLDLTDPDNPVPLSRLVAELDPDRVTAVGEVLDDDPEPFLFLHTPSPPCRETEGNVTVNLEVRLRNEDNTEFAPSASTRTAHVLAVDDTATAPSDYTELSTTVTFMPGQVFQTVTVQILDDEDSPQGEPDETFGVTLLDGSGTPLGRIYQVTCEILDDEVRVTVTQDVTVVEGNPLTFSLSLDRDPSADITVAYSLAERDGFPHPAQQGAACDPDTDVDYLELSSEITIRFPHDHNDTVELLPVATCDDALVEYNETFWLEISIGDGEAVVEAGEGAIGTITNDDVPTVSITAEPENATGTEGQEDPLRFAVTLTVEGEPAQLTEDITVEYAVGGGTATAPGETDADYAITLDTATPQQLTGTELSGTLTFTAGPPTVTEHVFEAELRADYLSEGVETFFVDLDNLYDPIGAAEFEDRDSNPITDDSYIEATIHEDPPPSLTVSGFSGSEGTDQHFTVTLDNPRAETVEVDYTIAGAGDYPATDPAVGETLHDYTAASGSLTGTLTFRGDDTPLLDGTIRRSVGVSLRRDFLAETYETLWLTLSNPQRAVLGDSDPFTPGTQVYGQGIIENVDGPALFVNNPSAREGESLTFTITLCNPVAGEDVTVRYQTLARSAAAGLDYTATSGELTFLRTTEPVLVTSGCGAGVIADAKTLTVDVAILADRIDESDEEVHLVLSDQAPNHIGLGKAIGVGRIINVPAATVRASNPTAIEGDPLEFVISLKDETGGLVGDRAPGAEIAQPVRVYYATRDRTATAGEDYTPVPAIPGPCLAATPPPPGCPFVEFDPNDNVRDFTVAVATSTDNLDEDDEMVALVLRLEDSTANAGLGDSEGTGIIVDQLPPHIRIDNPDAVSEGEDVVFTVSLSDGDGDPTTSSETVTVWYATGDRTAVAGSDYVAESGRVSFAPGDQQQPITVSTLTDSVWEPDETFRVDLSLPTNAILDRATGIGTIQAGCIDVQDDSDVPEISVENATAVEGRGVPFEVYVGYSRPLCDDYSLERTYEEGTATGEIGHLSPGTPTTRNFAARNSREKRHRIHWFTLRDDDIDEPDEEFYVDVNWGTGMPTRFQGQPAARGVLTIIDDDPPSNLRVADASTRAGTAMAFEVSLDRASGYEITVAYETSDADAVAPDDYQPVRGTLRFAPGETTRTLVVQTEPNSLGEGDEAFVLELSNPVNANIDDNIALGTILAGTGPSLQIFDAAADEGDTMRLRVEMSQASAQPVTVEYATVERSGQGAADEGADYQPAMGMLTFAPGDTEEYIDVTINADDEDEVDETFLVELSNQTEGVSLADPSAVATINGNIACVDGRESSGQAMPTAEITGTQASEDDERMTMTFTVTEPMCRRYEIIFQVWSPQQWWRLGTTAILGEDFLEPRAVTLLAGDTEVEFFVDLIDDDLVEGDENFRLRATNTIRPGHRDMGVLNLFPVIVDDDVATLQLPAAGETSTDEGGALSFVVRLDKPRDAGNVTFDYEVSQGPFPAASANVDFTPNSGTAIIPAGELALTVVVPTVEDSLDEDNENVLFTVSNINGAQPDPRGDTAVGVIFDDDDPPNARVSDASADEGGTLDFAVTLSAPSGRTVSIPVATRDGTASAADGDYMTLASTQVVFAPGATRQVLPVQTLDDDVVESSEDVWLDLGPMPANNDTATIGDSLGRGVIRDTSDRRVSVSDAAVIEGGNLEFEVGFAEGPSSRDVTVRYRTRAGTAAPRDDYNDQFDAATRELKIVAGDTSATVIVPTVDDRLDEDNETLELVLSSPSGAEIVDGTASGVIIDDDPEPELRVSDAEATEAEGATATFTLSLSEPSGRDVDATYTTADSTAAAGDDYTAPTGLTPGSNPTATIPAGDTSTTVGVSLINDDIQEDIETFQLLITGAVNAQRGDSIAVGTILDDDGPPQIIVDDPASAYEGEGASVAFTVRLTKADPENAVTVTYSTADGTAVAGSDYTAATSQTLRFPAGSEHQTVTVPLVNDDIEEDAETFRLVLSGPSSNAEIAHGTATALILDDDSLPTLDVTDAAAAAEGTAATFTINSSHPAQQDITVGYAAITDPTAADETAAVAGQDYTATFGTATVTARATSTTVTVPLLDDPFDEYVETFWLRLFSPTGATIVDDTATGTIEDDDPLPAIAITDAEAEEGTTLIFEVRLDAASGRTVTVPWATEALPADISAASPGEDYTTTSGTVTLNPGATTARIEVATLPDETDEANERFLVQLGTPTNAALDDGTAVGAILDDDGQPRISIGDTTVEENNGPAIFRVRLSHPSSQPVTVGYNTADGTATTHTATIPGDYAPDQVRTLTIPAALTQGEISVFIYDDTDTEGTETFTITLINPVNAVIAEGAGTATGTILDDEGPPRLTISDGTASEGDGTIAFPVNLSHAASEETSVRYSTFDGTATQPKDYTAATGTLTIPASDTTATITVAINDDNFFEVSESFVLRLHDPTGVEIAAAAAVGLILDDDTRPLASLGDNQRVREDAGTVRIVASLEPVSDSQVTVNYRLVNSSVTGPGCPRVPILPRPESRAFGTLVFEPHESTQTFTVDIVGDPAICTYEGENRRGISFNAVLTDSDEAEISPGFGGVTRVTIYDVQQPPNVQVFTRPVLESAGEAVFTLESTYPQDQDIEVEYTITPITATAGEDYADVTGGTATIPAFQLQAPLSVAIIDDDIDESTEAFQLDLTDVTNAVLDPRYGGLYAYQYINDDDDRAALRAGDAEVSEGIGSVAVPITLTRPSDQTVTVDYETSGWTATSPSDYAFTSGTATFAAGDTRVIVWVPIEDDDIEEDDEAFFFSLSNENGADVSYRSGKVTIQDDDGDSLPTLTLADHSDFEAGGVFAFDMTLTLSEASEDPVMVKWDYVTAPWLGDEAADHSDVPVPHWSLRWTTIPAGNTSWPLRIFVVDDTVPERNERFMVVPYDPVNAILGTQHAWFTIIDDDRPRVTVADVQVGESDGTAVFTLQLHAPGVFPASLDYTTFVMSSADAPASPGDDYTTASGTIDFPAGTTTATISVPIIADIVDEDDETFLLVLSNPDSLEFLDPIAVGTITDDDDGFWIRNRSVWENAGTMDFTVQRDHTSTTPVTVNYRIGNGGSAVGGTSCTEDGTDYVTPTGTVTMAATATTATISIEICDDEESEGRENLLVELTNVTGRQTTAVGTIVDDDRSDLPRINIGDSASRNETLLSISGANFIISADGPLTDTVTVTWRTENCLATDTDCPHPAAAGHDYTAVSGGTATLTPDSTTSTVTVSVLTDQIKEDDEQYFVRIIGVSGPAVIGSGATRADPVGIGTILDDD